MTIKQIEPLVIPQGDTITLEFIIEEENNKTPDLSDFQGFYVLSPYGFEDENALSKQMTLSFETTNKFEVLLTSEDTSELLGTYTAKVILQHGDNYYKKIRGIVDVVKDSNGIEVTM